MALVIQKDRSYGSSWKKRGGVGAFMMLARKWDRLEELVCPKIGGGHNAYDIFRAISRCSVDAQGADGTVLAEVRDLRRYLLLVEAEMMERGAVVSSTRASLDPSPVPLTEENHHAQRVGQLNADYIQEEKEKE